MTDLNADPSARLAIDSAALAWTPSPSGSVWRKRLHRSGPEETGRVTSVVRYDAKSRFPAHEHPDGEEILVLDGVFSDEHGDWPAGSYLLNPEGFLHAPHSDAGCLLFVKLRQYPGLGRPHLSVQTRDLAWQPAGPGAAGVHVKPLYAAAEYSESMRLEAWTPDRAAATYPRGVEVFVLSGGFADELGEHGPGAWLRLPAGSRHEAQVSERCEVYVKEAGLGLIQA